MARKSGRVTATEVALRSGVSQATVSYVLNRSTSQKISDETRARVLQAVDELGYTPYEPARTLALGKSNIVLFVAPRMPAGHVVSELVDLLSTLLAAQGRTLLTHRVSEAMSLVEVVSALSPYAVISMVPIAEPELRALRGAGALVELIGFAEPSEARDAQVIQPQQRIGRMQAEHLVDRGHRVLGYAQPSDTASALFYEPRLVGVRHVCAERGLPDPVVLSVPLDPAGAAEAVATWTNSGVTAVCAFNDDVAIAVLGGARERGVSVPDQLAVVGVDDTPLSALVTPPLTSVRIAVGVMARELARPLAHHSESAPHSAVEVDDTRIIVRASS
jgi:DNA-binding LacI/PurR family transcriptional regulator